MDLSVFIPARNEEFLGRTIDNILANMRGKTEVIAICDGYWSEPPVHDNPNVIIVHNTVPIGQRAAVNEGARLSRAKFVMKLDAHSAVDEGFDLKLMADYEKGWTVIPRMYNLHAFDWRCQQCGNNTYQGPRPPMCEKCKNQKDPGDGAIHHASVEEEVAQRLSQPPPQRGLARGCGAVDAR